MTTVSDFWKNFDPYTERAASEREAERLAAEEKAAAEREAKRFADEERAREALEMKKQARREARLEALYGTSEGKKITYRAVRRTRKGD